MTDPHNQESPGDDPTFESIMERFEQLDPAELANMNPERIQKLLGGAKLGEVFAQFQEQARAMVEQMAQHQGIDLNDLGEDEDDDWRDEDEDDFPDDVMDESFFARPTAPDGSFDDYPGAEQLWQHALQLDQDERLQVSIEINSPPVTDIEKIYYSTCHYRLIFDLFDTKAAFRDVTTPRQDYLHGKGWPAMLGLPRQSWPDLEPLWDTIRVEQFNLREALRSNDHQSSAREDLVPFAKQALQAGLSG